MLNKSVLIEELSKFADFESSNFNTFPENVPEAAALWSSAIDKYLGVVTPDSTTSSAAKAAFQSSFMSINNASGNGLIVLALSIQTYATVLATGMLPKFTGVPPTAPLILEPVMSIGMSGGSSSDCINMLASLIDTWAKTGTAVQIPTGVVIPWT